ncbi:MAG: hypothetical protein AB8B48_08065 [Pseudomonadales bacterium]
MDWIQIGLAIMFIAMMVYIWPNVKHSIKNSPEAEKGDWTAAALPIAGVVLFVVLLMNMV